MALYFSCGKTSGPKATRDYSPAPSALHGSQRLMVSLTILFLGVVLTRFFSQLISSSLNLLVKDTERIKGFHLDDQQSIHSNISEIAYLTDAMESMKSSLRAFKKFVPTDLVRQLIQSGEGAGIGGGE